MMRLRRRTKAGYGVADLGLSGAELLLQFYLFEFYTLVVGLEPVLAGVALALAVFWDAVSDPLMGLITDRTRSRYGRFIPWLVIGALTYPACFGLLFNPPEMHSQLQMFLYLLATYALVNTTTTILGVPHMAMGGALTEDTDERTEVYGWRLGFGTIGLFVGILMPLAMAALFQLDVADPAELGMSRNLAGWAMGAVVLGATAVTVVACRKATVGGEVSAALTVRGMLRGVGRVFRNRYFMPLLIAFILVAVARAMNATLALPFYKITLALEEHVIQQRILGVFSVCIILSIPLWVFLSGRYGKKWPAFGAMLGLGVMTIIAYPLFPVGSVSGPMVAAVLGGVLAGAIILFESMVPDVADADRLEDDDNREGVYFGFWRMGQKLARSVGLALTGIITGWIGLDVEAVEQSAEVARRLAWLFGPGVGVFFVAAALVFARMPMSHGDQLRIQERMAARRERRARPHR